MYSQYAACKKVNCVAQWLPNYYSNVILKNNTKLVGATCKSVSSSECKYFLPVFANGNKAGPERTFSAALIICMSAYCERKSDIARLGG